MGKNIITPVFDSEYGLSGAEGRVFFDLLSEYKFKFVVCREAIAYEVVLKYRTKLKFIFNHFFQSRNNIVWRAIESGNNKFRRIKFFYFIRTLLGGIYYGLQSLFFLPLKRKWIFSFIGLSLNLGKQAAVFGKKFYIYKTVHKSFEER